MADEPENECLTKVPRWARMWEESPMTEAEEKMILDICNDPNPNRPGRLSPDMLLRIAKRKALRNS